MGASSIVKFLSMVVVLRSALSLISVDLILLISNIFIRPIRSDHGLRSSLLLLGGWRVNSFLGLFGRRIWMWMGCFGCGYVLARGVVCWWFVWEAESVC